MCQGLIYLSLVWNAWNFVQSGFGTGNNFRVMEQGHSQIAREAISFQKLFGQHGNLSSGFLWVKKKFLYGLSAGNVYIWIVKQGPVCKQFLIKQPIAVVCYGFCRTRVSQYRQNGRGVPSVSSQLIKPPFVFGFTRFEVPQSLKSIQKRLERVFQCFCGLGKIFIQIVSNSLFQYLGMKPG